MKKLIPLIGIFLLLASCYSNPKDLEKIELLEKRIENLENQQVLAEKENIFERTRECEILVKDLDISSSRGESSFGEVFFSTSEQDCFYTVIIKTPNYDKAEYLHRLGINWGNSNSIASCIDYRETTKYDSTIEGCNHFHEKIKELKNNT